MHVRHPVWIKRISRPGSEAFAVLFTLESSARAMLASVIPLEAFRLLGSAQQVSLLFFAVSLVGLGCSFSVPLLVRRFNRRLVYSLAASLLLLAPASLALQSVPGQLAGMALRVAGTVGLAICLNLYIMDHISRQDFSRSEPQRIFYSAAAWTAGPALGVYLGTAVAAWLPYAASAAAAALLIGYFWFLRLTDNPALARPKGKTPAPATYLRRYLSQPRLRLAWLIAVARNTWWGVFFIYTPIFAVQSGLGEIAGGLIVSAGSGFLFLLPLWGWCVRHFGVRRVLVGGFLTAGSVTAAAAALMGEPWAAAALLLAGAFASVALDGVGNVPFLLAVRAGERPEMTMVYSTYRDAAELGPPAVFSVVLRYFELSAVFALSGAGLIAVAGLCRLIHPRLGLSPEVRRASRPISPLAAGSPAGRGAFPGRP